MFPEQNNLSESEGELSIDVRRYLALAWHWAWLIVLATVLAAGAAYLITRQMTPVYQASTTLLINEAPSNKTADYNALLTSERQARTYAQLMSKRPVLEAVIGQLGLDLNPDALHEMVSINLVRDTQLIVIDVQDTDPERAAQIANTLVIVFSDQLQATQASRFASSKDSLQKQIGDVETQIEATRDQIQAAQDADETARLETRLTQHQQTYNNLIMSFEQVRMAEAQTLSGVAQVEPAITPRAPIRPNVFQNTILAGLVGLMLAAGLIFALDALDDTVKDPEEISKQFRLPVLGVIAEFAGDEQELITLHAPRAPVSEAFRSLRTNIQYASVDKPIRSLLVTSAAPSDGKTTIISNLAVVMAQGGRRVTLVDADLHRPRIHRVFESDNSSGLSGIFVQPKVQLNGWVQATNLPGLQLVSSGALPPNPSELLGSNKMREILDALLADNDIVLLDTPPVLSVTDSSVLAPLVDAVLLVIRPGATHSGALKQAIEQLHRVNANLIGFVINGIGLHNSSYSYYYRDYYKRYTNYYEPVSASRNGKRVGKGIGFFNRKPQRKHTHPVAVDPSLQSKK